MARRPRLLLLACLALALTWCLCSTLAVSGASAPTTGAASTTTKSTPTTTNTPSPAADETEAARVIRERAAARDRKIAEKQAKKQAAAAKAAQEAATAAAAATETKPKKEQKDEKKATSKKQKKEKKTDAAAETKASEEKAAAKKAADEKVAAEKAAREQVEKDAAAAAAAAEKQKADGAAAAKAKKEKKAKKKSNDDAKASKKETAPETKKASAKEEAKPATPTPTPTKAKVEEKPRASAPVLSDAEALSQLRARLASEREATMKAQRAPTDRVRRRTQALQKARVERRTRRDERRVKRKRQEESRRRARAEAQKPEIVARGAEKLKWYEKQMRNAKKSKAIDISYSNFKTYVHTSPRPYWLFVTLTAMGERYSCSICRTVDPEIRKLAAVYEAERLRLEEERAKNGSSVAVKTESDFASDKEYDAWRRSQMPLFFVNVDIADNGDVFRLLNLQSAPTMFIMPPTFASTPPAMSALLTSLPKANQYILTKADISAHDLNDFIHKVTGRQVALTQKREPGLRGWITLGKDLLAAMDPVRYIVLCVACTMLVLLAVLFAGQRLVWHRFQTYRERAALKAGIVTRDLAPRDLVPVRVYSQYTSELMATAHGTPALSRSCSGVVSGPGAFAKPRALGLFRWWFIVVAELVYLFGISGGMFSILRGQSFSSHALPTTWRALMNFDIWRLLGGDAHDQSAMEGVTAGLLQLVLASILIALNRCAFTHRVVHAPGTAGAKESRTVTARLTSVLAWCASCLASPLLWGAVFFLTWRLILAIYTRKNGGYRHGFVWQHLQPQHFRFLQQYAAKVLGYFPKFVGQAVYRWF